VEKVVQLGKRDGQLLLLVAHTDSRQHLGVRNKDCRHEFLNIVTPAIVQNLVDIALNDCLIPNRYFGAKILKDAHSGLPLSSGNPIVLSAEKLHKRWHNPCTQLLQVLIPSLGVDRNIFHSPKLGAESLRRDQPQRLGD
jgi:hypothetical protein